MVRSFGVCLPPVKKRRHENWTYFVVCLLQVVETSTQVSFKLLRVCWLLDANKEKSRCERLNDRYFAVCYKKEDRQAGGKTEIGMIDWVYLELGTSGVCMDWQSKSQ